jgi:type I restriction enzyme S subunit
LLEKFIAKSEFEERYQHFTVNAGDILLSSSGNSWGKISIFDGEEAVMLNTSTIRLNTNSEGALTREYLVLLLRSELVREQLGVAMTGSCQPNFGPTHLGRVVITVPPRAEQERLVAMLQEPATKLNQLLNTAQQAIDLLLERRSALISAAVTGQIDVRTFVASEAA